MPEYACKCGHLSGKHIVGEKVIACQVGGCPCYSWELEEIVATIGEVLDGVRY